MRKRRMKFYGQLIRIDKNGFAKTIFEFIVRLKAITKWADKLRFESRQKDPQQKGVLKSNGSPQKSQEKQLQSRPKLTIHRSIETLVQNKKECQKALKNVARSTTDHSRKNPGTSNTQNKFEWDRPRYLYNYCIKNGWDLDFPKLKHLL